jgi:hypothetical protein
MRQIHLYAGYAIAAGWALLFAWGCVLWLLGRAAGGWYGALLAVLQVAVGLQVVSGLVLVVAGGRPEVLHYFYGGLAPAIVLAIAHVLAGGLSDRPDHTIFTVAAFIVFGLTARAAMTGLGAG